jgi:AcrR family transcriptional regulator
MVEDGLRERNKAQRRTAIIRAAFTLFAQHGYDATTVVDIAAAAEVSPRTVALYFPTKLDIALSRFTEAAERLAEAINGRLPGETVTQIMGQWLGDKHEESCEDDLPDLGRRMFEANPELRALRTARMAAAIREGVRAFAEDLGTTPDDVRPRIAAAAAAAVLIEIADNPADVDHQQAVSTALSFLQGGLACL